MSDLKLFLGPMRLPFLILTPACVLLGIATAVRSSAGVNTLHVVLVLLGAAAAHVSVNAFNEYGDFKSGLDFKVRRTPFSGGSGTLPEQPDLARRTLITAWVALAVTCLIGLYFLFSRGLLLLPLGALGILLVYVYTSWLTRSPFMCLIAPGLGFGLFMVIGTHFVLTGEYSWAPFTVSLVPFFLVSNLLLLNQFPDVEADRSVGRRNYPIVIGRRGSAWIYGAFLLAAYLVIVLAVRLGHLPAPSLMGLITVALAVPAITGAYRNADEVEKLIPSLILNVLIVILTPVLVAIGMFIA
jgi:1,4-dihydroxy-2-naphthoate octaprenyltransferase